MTPRRILFLCMANTVGGTERVVQNLAVHLTARGHHVHTLMPGGPKAQKTLDWYRAAGVSAEISPVLRTHFVARGLDYVRELGRIVRQSGADVVGIHYPELWYSYKDLLAARALGRKRCVVSVYHPTRREWITPSFTRTTRLASRLTNQIVVGTDILRDRLVELGVSPSKIVRVRYGIPVPAHFPTREEARARLRLPERAFVVSTLCRLTLQKGVADLIEGIARVPRSSKEVVLAIGGDGEDREHLEVLAAERLGGRARFLGHVPDTAYLYAASDVFSMPSHDEGFGLVFIEAGFHSVPSVGTRVGGIPEAIEDGQTGLLVPVTDPDALGQVIGTLRDDKRLVERLGSAARTRACAEFTASTMAERYEQVLFPC